MRTLTSFFMILYIFDGMTFLTYIYIYIRNKKRMAARVLTESFICMENAEDGIYNVIHTENAKRAKTMILNTMYNYLYDYLDPIYDYDDDDRIILFLKTFHNQTTTKIVLLREFDFLSMTYTIDAIITNE